MFIYEAKLSLAFYKSTCCNQFYVLLNVLPVVTELLSVGGTGGVGEIAGVHIKRKADSVQLFNFVHIRWQQFNKNREDE